MPDGYTMTSGKKCTTTGLSSSSVCTITSSTEIYISTIAIQDIPAATSLSI